jgi:WD40 repeat protein
VEASVIEDPPEYRAARLTGPGEGSRVASYRLEKQIGAGGMAVVYRARDERLGRLVALKIMAPALAADEMFRLRFIRESRAAAAVDDPHIIPVYEAGEENGLLFIAIRFVNGGDVRSLLHRQGPLPMPQVMSIVSSVGAALDAAHAVGLVHRDVKPANMLLDTRAGRPDHVYLSDFGLSKVMQSAQLTGSGQFLGTPNYMSPEQIEGRTVDGRTDQYALACAAFELLTGNAPFGPSEGWATVFAHLNTQPPPLTSRRPDLSPAVDEVFARALAKDPRDRYASCREFGEALQEALAGPPARGPAAPAYPAVTESRVPVTVTVGQNGGPPAPANPGGGHRGSRPSRRRGLITVTLAGVVVAAAAFVLYYANGGGDLRNPGNPASTAGPALYSRIRSFTAPRLDGRMPYVSSVAFSPDGKTLATGMTTETSEDPGNPGKTLLWNVATGKREATLPGSGGAEAFSPDGKVLATAGGLGNSLVKLWNTATWTNTGVLTGDVDSTTNDVAFSPDGRLAGANDSGGVVYLFGATGKHSFTILGGPGTYSSFTLAFGPDGNTLATGENGDRVFLWDLGLGTRSATLKGDGNAQITSVTFSPDGSLLAASDQNGHIYIWNVATLNRIGMITDPGSYGVDALAFSPDDSLLAAGDGNGRTYLWNLPAQTLAAKLVNPNGPVTSLLTGQSRNSVLSVAFSPDGKTLATSDTNGHAYLWRVR